MLNVSTVVGAVTLWAIWKLWCRIVVKSPMKTLDGPPALSFVTGNITQMNDPDGLAFNRMIVDKYGGAAKIYGFLGDEQIYFSDPLALRHIVVKNQNIFDETNVFLEINRVMFGDALTAVKGFHHKKQRRILNPAFAASHMRDLVPIVSNIVVQMSDLIERAVRRGETTVNALDIMWRTGIETLGHAGLGYSFDALNETKRSVYTDSVKDMFPTLDKMGILLLFLPLVSRLGSEAFRQRFIRSIPWQKLKDCIRLVDIIDDNGRKVLSKGRAALALGDDANSQRIGKGKDIMTLLLKANELASESDRLPDAEVIAQINLLIFASADTTSSTMTKAMEHLSRNPDVQERLRREILDAVPDIGAMTYDTLENMPLLSAVIKETLRLNPPVIKMERTATEDTVVPLYFPVIGTDGKPITEVHVRKNQNVIIGIGNVNRHKRIWGPDADEWKPDRWLKPLPESVTDAHIPGIVPHIMSFLAGERACIGYAFALTEMKVILSIFISRFHFSPSDKPVSWKLGAGTQYPVVPGKGSQLPLEVGLV
ncbi:hypothetical protein AX16_005851 [Volvariella volvacea WC 439]|nr:hypothetical protein AX16_005851 [Volvariella volvacea WC 439]